MRYNRLKLNKSELCQTRLDMKYFQHIYFYHWVKRNYDNNQRFLRSQHCLAVTTDHRSEIKDKRSRIRHHISDIMYQRSYIRDRSQIRDQRSVIVGHSSWLGEAKGPSPALMSPYARRLYIDIIDTRYQISLIPDIRYQISSIPDRSTQLSSRDDRRKNSADMVVRKHKKNGRSWWAVLLFMTYPDMAEKGVEWNFVEKSCFGKEYSWTIAKFWTFQVCDLKPPIIYFPLF